MATPHQPTTKSVPWVKVLLFLSLALNLLVVGVVAGAFFRPGHAPDRRSPEIALRGDLGLGPYGQAMDRNDRRQLREALVSRAPDRRDTAAKMRSSMVDIISAMRSTPFKIDDVRALIDVQQSRIVGSQDDSKDLFLDHLAGLDDAGRQAYADRLEKVISRARP